MQATQSSPVDNQESYVLRFIFGALQVVPGGNGTVKFPWIQRQHSLWMLGWCFPTFPMLVMKKENRNMVIIIVNVILNLKVASRLGLFWLGHLPGIFFPSTCYLREAMLCFCWFTGERVARATLRENLVMDGPADGDGTRSQRGTSHALPHAPRERSLLFMRGERGGASENIWQKSTWKKSSVVFNLLCESFEDRGAHENLEVGKEGQRLALITSLTDPNIYVLYFHHISWKVHEWQPKTWCEAFPCVLIYDWTTVGMYGQLANLPRVILLTLSEIKVCKVPQKVQMLVVGAVPLASNA